MEFFSSYSGPDFLAFYGVMLVTCIIAGLWVPANLRPVGRPSDVHEMEEAAVLAGGKKRHVAAVLADLTARDALVSPRANKLSVRRTEIETGSAGRTLLRKVADFDFKEARQSIEADAEAIEGDLVRRGLLMTEGENFMLRLYSITPYLSLFLLGLYRQQAGAAEGEPTGFLVVLLALTAALALLRFLVHNPRTKEGVAAMRELEATATPTRRAPTAAQAGMSVAVFGTGVLVGTPWEPVHSMRQAGDGGFAGVGGGGGDGSSDAGGSGCGGGGCGGCGG